MSASPLHNSGDSHGLKRSRRLARQFPLQPTSSVTSSSTGSALSFPRWTRDQVDVRNHSSCSPTSPRIMAVFDYKR
jgi:hypothetical protein